MTDLEEQLRAYNAFRRGGGGTTNRERDEIKANLEEAHSRNDDNFQMTDLMNTRTTTSTMEEATMMPICNARMTP